MDAFGNSYENCVRLLLGQVASVVRVPRDQDFGIDFYCQPRVAEGAHTETVTELAAIQVKGGRARLAYGGFDERRHWREYEFTWLRSLAVPLYLTRVNRTFTIVELFSLWPLWLIFWRQTILPFEVRFVTSSATDRGTWRMPESQPHPSASQHGDGRRWTVYLGRPFLRLTPEVMAQETFRRQAVAILRSWIAADRLTLMRFQQFIPVLTGITEWEPNCPNASHTQTWQFWSGIPGENIDRLCRTAAPILVNLGNHLQWQDDHSAYALIPVLEWLEARHHLDEMGMGLLKGLRSTKSRGLGPAHGLPSPIPTAE